MQLHQAISGRRTIRAFSEQKVEKETLLQIVEAGLWAPSGTNKQAWKIVAIQDSDKLAEVKAVSAEAFKGKVEEKLNRMFAGKQHIIDATAGFSATLGGASSVILVFAKKMEDEEENEISIQSAAALTQNMCLTAYSLGLGSCWAGHILSKSDELASICSLDPIEYKITALVAVGYPLKEAKTVPRKENRAIFI